jgi:prepilin-type N-terminal cleavage/methylation domain-containing protein
MKKRRFGFTLVELIVVVAILALLAAMVLPRFDSLLKNAGHAAGASSMADTGQLIEAWYTANGNYPDGWDTRLSSSGALLTASTGVTPTAGSTAVLPTELVGATTGRLALGTLSAGDVLGFNNVGITTLYNLDAAPISELTRPNDWFNTATTISSSTQVAVINSGTGITAGNKIIDHIFRQNLVVGGVSGTLPSNSTGTTKLVAFGLGAHNTMVAGNNGSNLKTGLMIEAPVDGSFNSALMYNRLIVVFAVTPSTSGATSASSVVFAGVFGADGDLITDDAAALNGAVQ